MTEQNFTKEWLGKPYYSLDAYFKNTFSHKCYKIAIDAGMTCPNRDGKVGHGGCIFCSEGGSGDFAAKAPSMEEQIAMGKKLWGDKKTGDHFIAYFQSFTNTYAPIEKLEELYTKALSQKEIIGISIATRPDCLPLEVLELLARLQETYTPKFIWVELGLQTIHEKTANYIRRGYPLSTYEEATKNLKKFGIPFITHVILGLPGESPDEMFETISYLNKEMPFGVKLQLLHVLKNTDLATDYNNGKFPVLEKEEYLQILIHCLEILSPDIVIHRVTGDGPKDLLIAPKWSTNKRDVLNSLHKMLKEQETYQGRLYNATRPIDSL